MSIEDETLEHIQLLMKGKPWRRHPLRSRSFQGRWGRPQYERRKAQAERKDDTAMNDQGDENVDAEDKTLYQSVAATLNFCALDRTDIQWGVKEVMRHMSDPSVVHGNQLKRVL